MKQLLLCFWAYASCHVTCVHQPWTVNPCKQAHSLFFLKMGNLRWFSSPQPRFLPRSGLWGDHHSWITCPATSKFPAGSLWLFLLLQKLWLPLLTKRLRGCSDSGLSLSTKGYQNPPQLWKWHWSCHRCHCWPTMSWGKNPWLTRCQ